MDDVHQELLGNTLLYLAVVLLSFGLGYNVETYLANNNFVALIGYGVILVGAYGYLVWDTL